MSWTSSTFRTVPPRSNCPPDSEMFLHLPKYKLILHLRFNTCYYGLQINNMIPWPKPFLH